MTGNPEIRPYKPFDEVTLVTLHRAIFPDDTVSTNRIRQRLVTVLKSGGRIWLMTSGDVGVGYASVVPVPGLNEIGELRGGIDPNWRRRGLGSQLLAYLLADLRNSDFRQISYPVSTMDNPAALFFKHHDFFIEHVEYSFILENLRNCPDPDLPVGYRFHTYPRTIAISRFRQLYDQIFGEHPWYQPYHDDHSVAADLVDPADIIFLLREKQPIGFLWLHWPKVGQAEIEPVGILTGYQGRGLGRELLLSAIQLLAEQGASTVKIGFWQQNKVASRLYQSLGFKNESSLTYLACSINSK